MRSREIKRPWEKGPLAPLFTKRFSDEVATSVKPCRVGLRDILIPVPKIQASSSKMPVSSFSAINRRIAKCRINVAEDELRTKALNQFKVLISLDLDATHLGQSISNVLGAIDPSVDPLQVLQDAMSNKATGTLLKRASSMWRFACWLEHCELGTCFNQTEQVLYRYMNCMRDTGSAPTSASHFIESLRFLQSSFQISEDGCRSSAFHSCDWSVSQHVHQKEEVGASPSVSSQSSSGFRAAVHSFSRLPQTRDRWDTVVLHICVCEMV
jgi:hypothetical protein